MKYILDNNIHIKIHTGDIGIDHSSFAFFAEKFLVDTVPKSLFNELTCSWFENYTSIGSQQTTLNRPPICVISGDDKLNFNYSTSHDYGCEDVKVVDEEGKIKLVGKTDLEIIVKCLKEDIIYVTDDKSALYLARSLGVQVRSGNEFYEEVIKWCRNYYKPYDPATTTNTSKSE